MTHDINALLEQYNLAYYSSEDGFEEYYWHIAEEIGQTMFAKGVIGLRDMVEILTDMLELDEDDLKIDEIDSFLEEMFDAIKE